MSEGRSGNITTGEGIPQSMKCVDAFELGFLANRSLGKRSRFRLWMRLYSTSLASRQMASTTADVASVPGLLSSRAMNLCAGIGDKIDLLATSQWRRTRQYNSDPSSFEAKASICSALPQCPGQVSTVRTFTQLQSSRGLRTSRLHHHLPRHNIVASFFIPQVLRHATRQQRRQSPGPVKREEARESPVLRGTR